MSSWPPIIPPATRTDPDPQKTNHPADHNQMASALTQIVGKITDGSLTGPPGAQGYPGPQGPQGPQGLPGGPIPPGGTTGQVATKRTNADGDVIWATTAAGMNYRGVYDYTKAYAVNDVVIGKNGGRAYVAVNPVPSNAGQAQYFPGVPVGTAAVQLSVQPVTTLISLPLTTSLQAGHAYDVQVAGLGVDNSAGLSSALVTQAIAIDGNGIGSMNMTADAGRTLVFDQMFTYTPATLVANTLTITSTTSASPVPKRLNRYVQVRCLDRYYWQPLAVPTLGGLTQGMIALTDLADVAAGPMSSNEEQAVLSYSTRNQGWQTDQSYPRGVIAYRAGALSGLSMTANVIYQLTSFNAVPLLASRLYKLSYVVRGFSSGLAGTALEFLNGSNTSPGVNLTIDFYLAAGPNNALNGGTFFHPFTVNADGAYTFDLQIKCNQPALLYFDASCYALIEDIGINGRGRQ